MKKTIIIAEGGVNHNGKVSLAKKIITKAKEVGADYIKFQLYDADALSAPSAAAFSTLLTKQSASQLYKSHVYNKVNDSIGRMACIVKMFFLCTSCASHVCLHSTAHICCVHVHMVYARTRMYIRSLHACRHWVPLGGGIT